MPNKFFEFVQARLAIAIGPSPEMAAAVDRHDIGVVAADFEPRSLAERLSAMTLADLARYKGNVNGVARKFSAETTQRTLVEKALRGDVIQTVSELLPEEIQLAIYRA